jgi:hypothetical protein
MHTNSRGLLCLYARLDALTINSDSTLCIESLAGRSRADGVYTDAAYCVIIIEPTTPAWAAE